MMATPKIENSCFLGVSSTLRLQKKAAAQAKGSTDPLQIQILHLSGSPLHYFFLFLLLLDLLLRLAIYAI